MTSGVGTENQGRTTAGTSPAVAPRLSAAVLRKLYWAVPLTLVLTAAVAASLLLATGNAPWLTALAAAAGVSAAAAMASLAVVRLAADKPADVAVTVAMGLTLVRAGVTVIGIAVAIKLFSLPQAPTAYLACAFYAATLVVETLLMARAAAAQGGPADSAHANALEQGNAP